MSELCSLRRRSRASFWRVYSFSSFMMPLKIPSVATTAVSETSRSFLLLCAPGPYDTQPVIRVKIREIKDADIIRFIVVLIYFISSILT